MLDVHCDFSVLRLLQESEEVVQEPVLTSRWCKCVSQYISNFCSNTHCATESTCSVVYCLMLVEGTVHLRFAIPCTLLPQRLYCERYKLLTHAIQCHIENNAVQMLCHSWRCVVLCYAGKAL
jgi:hypothetical protein